MRWTSLQLPTALILAILIAGAGRCSGQQLPIGGLNEGLQALQSGNFSLARAIFSHLVEQSPSVENTDYLAIAEAGSGDVSQAISHFQDSIRLGNSSASVHNDLGMLYLRSGRPQQALHEFQIALDIDPNFVQSLCLQGAALLDVGAPQDALRYLDKAYGLARENEDVQRNLVRAHFELGDAATALHVISRIMRDYPDNPRTATALAGVCLRYGHIQDARRILEDANRRMPQNSEITLLLARVSLRAGNPEAAISVLDKLPEDAANSGEKLLLKGEALILTGDLERAEANITSAAHTDPENTRYLIALAGLKQRQGRYQDALEILSKAHQLDRNSPVISFQIAVADYYLHLPLQARQACENAISLDPTYASAYGLLAAIDFREKDFSGAERATQEAIKLNPNMPQFYTLAGAALYKQGKYEESIVQLDRALILDPRSAQAHFYRGQVFARKCNLHNAIADIETTVALVPTYRSAYAVLARLYESNGQPELARAAVVKAKKQPLTEERDDGLTIRDLQLSNYDSGSVSPNIRNLQ
jgi:tetratricopeptide (TPR) repeat protein